tara:strand:+ start:535 stop:1377 length:843 start_codon:yes stop_codon:yes gene_type:complete
MANYKNIHGLNIPIRTSDPSNPLIGEMWYNSTSNSLKGQINVASASWASGATYPSARRDATGFGTPTAAIIMGGNPANSTANTYDGSSWTSTTAIPANSSGADSDGPQTAGLFVGGSDTTANYDWNGSTWTAGAAIPGWSQGTSGGGTPAAAFVQGHQIATTGGTATKDYDGSTWTDGSVSNNGHNYGGGGGLPTNGIMFGGTSTPNPGTKTNVAETYDGTCWTTSATMVVGVSNAHGKATLNGATSSLCVTGNAPPPGYSDVTQDFTGSGPSTVTISSS